MTIRQPIRALLSWHTPKIHDNIHSPKQGQSISHTVCARCHLPIFLINNILPINQWHTTRHPNITAIARQPLARIRTALEPCARRTPGYSDGLVVKEVAVGITRRLYHHPRIPLLGGYGIPFLLARPVVRSSYVEEPVTFAGPDGVDLRHFGAVVEAKLRCYDIWGGGVCDDEFGEGGAGGGVVLCASVINLHRFGENAGFDVDDLAVLGVGDGVGERSEGGLADGLGGEELICDGFEGFARACCGGLRGEDAEDGGDDVVHCRR
jgi:hypothetical protein